MVTAWSYAVSRRANCRERAYDGAVGQILGVHFELLAEAARGGMGSVYRGRDLRTNRMVAIKVLNLSNASDHVRFERECQVLARLHHPNVVGYVAHGASPEGTRFLVQEWVDGITLSTQIQTLGLTARDAIKVAIGVSDALGAAHALGAVHRDVKPANIILDAGDPDRVKLVDFGIARMEADAGVLTRAGILVGTPSYMAPEQARGLVAITPAADVWALGCVLYEAISGRKAFAGRSPKRSSRRRCSTSPRVSTSSRPRSRPSSPTSFIR